LIAWTSGFRRDNDIVALGCGGERRLLSEHYPHM
jgi:hypothetical protein